MIFRHKNTHSPHNFRGKPGTTLAIIPVQYSMQSYHKERKRKSSSGKSLTGRGACDGHIPSESALSLINFNHKISSLTHNFRGKPGTTLAIIKVQDSMTYNFTPKDSDLIATTSVDMPAILIGTNSTQDVEQDLVLLSIIEEMKNE